jgi:hypothetical protein
MKFRNRALSGFLAACYLLAVTASSFFHDHGGLHDCIAEHSNIPCFSEEFEASDGPVAKSGGESHSRVPPCSSDDRCSVCHFMAQSTISMDGVPHLNCSALPEEVVAASPVRVPHRSLACWHSRAPPALA